jgi:hypothetical protein
MKARAKGIGLISGQRMMKKVLVQALEIGFRENGERGTRFKNMT